MRHGGEWRRDEGDRHQWLWRAPPADGRDWRAGRWWEHGFVRRVKLPEDTEWRKVKAYFDDGEGSLAIKVPKAGDAHQATA
ncbi:unnamed protein product [Urochloa humidicola]